MFVYALFWDEETASQAVQNLLDAQFGAEEISVLLRHEGSAQETGLEHKTGVFPGALLGPLLGAIGGALVIPAVGWLAAGPLLATLEGAYVGGATGYLVGVLGGLGFWRDEIAHTHEQDLHRGAVLIGVSAQGRDTLAQQVLQKAGAETVHRGTKVEASEDIRLRGRLGEDHQAIDKQLALLAAAAATGDFVAVDQCLSHVEPQLRGHMDGEDKYLFTQLESTHPEEIGALRTEHQQLLKTFGELGVNAELHTLRKEQVDELIDALRAHAKREDKHLYQWADELPAHSRRLMTSFLLGVRARLHLNKSSKQAESRDNA